MKINKIFLRYILQRLPMYHDEVLSLEQIIKHFGLDDDKDYNPEATQEELVEYIMNKISEE